MIWLAPIYASLAMLMLASVNFGLTFFEEIEPTIGLIFSTWKTSTIFELTKKTPLLTALSTVSKGDSLVDRVNCYLFRSSSSLSLAASLLS